MNNFIHTNNDGYIRKNWINALRKFKNKKIKILEIGVYEGESTKWFLSNFMTHKDSVLYAVDSFEGSPEYNRNHFISTVKQKFLKSIKSTKKEKHVKIMEMYSYNALIELISKNDGKLMFDIIYIDASHEAKDVISDAILSWNILNIGGVVIFDDYKWNLLLQEFSKPKIAVDSFLEIMKPTINILHKGYQVIIEKKKLDVANEPIPMPKNKPLKKIMEEINNLYTDVSNEFIFNYSNKNSKSIKNNKNNLETLIDENKTLIENVVYKHNNITNSPNLLITSMSYNIEFYSENPIFNMIKNRYDVQVKNSEEVANKFKMFNDVIVERSRNNTFIKCWLDFYYGNYYTTDSLVSIIKNCKTKSTTPTLLHFKYIYDYSGQFKKNEELNYFKSRIDNIFKYYHKTTKYKLVDISCTANHFDNKNIIQKNTKYNDIIHNQLNLNSPENITQLADMYKSKIDLLNLQYDLSYSKNKCNLQQVNNLMLFALTTQRIGGSCHIQICNKLSVDMYKLINTFSKYYKKLTFHIPKCYLAINNIMTIKATDFIGITTTELKQLNNNTIITNKNKSVESSLPRGLILFNEELYNKYSSELKLIKRLNSICNELYDQNYDDYLKNVNNKIFNKQLEYLFLWINTLIK